ncbi:hypothetical protein FOL47_007503 [Perkinsus chesapeaki]|uniref:Uncharacterized protein n=1 Tax=Perkinsus chesapeaki TaxID=330153 RepID=A0A7J6LK07_PERCH|nr:hypothetical protein FOL47_007503 [Perkinsus chesapeaki]
MSDSPPESPSDQSPEEFLQPDSSEAEGENSPSKRSTPIQVSLKPDISSDAITVRSITGGAGSPLTKSSGEVTKLPDGSSQSDNAESDNKEAKEAAEPVSVEEEGLAKIQRVLTSDVDILSKLAHDVERISTEVSRIGSARCPISRGGKTKGRHVRVDSARVARMRSIPGMSTNVHYLQRKLTEADAQVTAQEATISNLRHDNAVLRIELDRLRTELREEKRRSGDLRRKLMASNKNLESTRVKLKQVSVGVSKIGALVKYSAPHVIPHISQELPVIPELPPGSGADSERTKGMPTKGGQRQLTPRVRTSGGEIPFRPSHETLRKAVDIYSRK